VHRRFLSSSRFQLAVLTGHADFRHFAIAAGSTFYLTISDYFNIYKKKGIGKCFLEKYFSGQKRLSNNHNRDSLLAKKIGKPVHHFQNIVHRSLSKGGDEAIFFAL